MKYCLVLLTCLLLSDATLACTVFPPSIEGLNNRNAHVITSPNQHFFLKLTPSRWQKGIYNSDWVLIKKDHIRSRKKISKATAYELLPDGKFKELWSLDNWENNRGVYTKSGRFTAHAYSFFLSNDGMNLVGISLNKHVNDERAVVMFHKGVKVKSLTPLEFGVSEIKPSPPCNRYYWIKGNKIQKVSRYSSEIKITTVNNGQWVIDTDSLKLFQVNLVHDSSTKGHSK